MCSWINYRELPACQKSFRSSVTFVSYTCPQGQHSNHENRDDSAVIVSLFNLACKSLGLPIDSVPEQSQYCVISSPEASCFCIRFLF